MLTMSTSGISIGLPVRKDVKTPLRVIGAVGSGPASSEPFFSVSLSPVFLSEFSSIKSFNT